MKYTGTHQGAGELRNFKKILLLAVAMLAVTGKVCAQTQATGGETPSPVVVPDTGKTQSTEQTQKHRFWDKKNDLLFAGVGASYLFHRYGHHKLERWTSMVHFGLATTGAVRNYCLKTAHPKTTP